MEGRQYFLSGIRRSAARQNVALIRSDDAALPMSCRIHDASGHLFTARGFDSVAKQVDASTPETRRAEVLDACLPVLQTMLASL
jgi:hypothetical protein